jgi:Ca2+-binding RTX toxin-like protein
MSRLRRATAFIPLIAALGAISVLPGAAQGAHGGFCSAELAEGAPEYNVIYAVAGVATQGSDGDDLIIGTSGDDVINGGNGDDLICGRGGSDTLSGGNGNDQVLGDVGCAAGPGMPAAFPACAGAQGVAGTDTVTGGNGDDILWGDQGNDTVTGGNGDDVIFGANVGQDGPATSDTCDGGRGADTDRGAFCDSSSNIETSTAS